MYARRLEESEQGMSTSSFSFAMVLVVPDTAAATKEWSREEKVS